MKNVMKNKKAANIKVYGFIEAGEEGFEPP